VTTVDDQHGCPTFTEELAAAVRRLVLAWLTGVLHVTNQGATTTWWGLACEVFELIGADVGRVVPIPTAEVRPARAAARPVNSVLDNADSRLSGMPLLAHHGEPLRQLVGVLCG
jgi:dTDP-4-dehydrorhamnose reductase